MKRVRIVSEPDEDEIQTIRESDLVPLDEVFGAYSESSVTIDRRDYLERFALCLGDSGYEDFVPEVAIDDDGMYILYFRKKEDE